MFRQVELFKTKRWRLLVGLALATAAAGYCAYLRAFTGFSTYDDEGVLLMEVKQFLEGGALYDRVYSPYGPIYFLYQWFLHSIIRAPVSHEVARLGMLFPWLAASLLCAGVTFRIVRSIFYALLAHFLVFTVLDHLTYEPGHPQELCLLLMTALTAAAGVAGASPRWRVAAMIAFGAGCAGLMLTKINAGAYASAAIGLVLAASTRGTRLPRYIYLAAGAASVALPALLFSAHLDAAWGRRFLVVATASIASVVLAVWRCERLQCLGARDWGIMLSAFWVTCAGGIAFSLARGTTLRALIEWTVVQNLGLASRWYIGLNMRWIAVPWAAGALGLAVLYAWRDRWRPEVAAVMEQGLPFVKLAYGIAAPVFALAFTPALLAYGAPFVWLAAIAPSGEAGNQFGRAAVALMAALMTLYAYPVAGTQVWFAAVLIAVAGVICLSDAVCSLAPWLPARRTAQATAALILAAGYGYHLYHDYRDHFSKTPLDLPGAWSIRVAARQRTELHWLVAKIASCDTFIATPGMPSLYFWTGERPPTAINVDNWMNLLSGTQQETIVKAFSRYPHSCVLYSPRQSRFWLRGQNLSAMPLGRYILEHFREADEQYGYFVLVRDDRHGGAPGAATDSGPPHSRMPG
jgi:hypothetical protein